MLNAKRQIKSNKVNSGQIKSKKYQPATNSNHKLKKRPKTQRTKKNNTLSRFGTAFLRFLADPCVSLQMLAVPCRLRRNLQPI